MNGPARITLPLGPIEDAIAAAMRERGIKRYPLLGKTLDAAYKQALDAGRIRIEVAERICEGPLRSHARCVYGFAWDLAAQLTPHRLRIIGLVAEGYTSEQIGRQIGTTTHAVDLVIGKLLRAIGARSRAHAVALVVSAGFVNVTPEPELQGVAA